MKCLSIIFACYRNLQPKKLFSDSLVLYLTWKFDLCNYWENEKPSISFSLRKVKRICKHTNKLKHSQFYTKTHSCTHTETSGPEKIETNK